MKKLLVIVLCVAMMLTALPTVAMAAEEEPVPVASVSLSKSELALKIDATSQLTAAVLPAEATDKSVTWTSSNESVATVSETGLVTAKDTGIAQITATANDGSGKSASCTVKVNCGTWGGIDWTLTADGTLTISPTAGTPVADPNSGKVFEVGAWREAVRYNSAGVGKAIEGWPYDRTKVKKLIIEEGVTSIGSFVLDGCTTVGGELVIPKTVTYIGQQAFNACGFTKVTFEVYENGQSDLRCIATASFQRQPNVKEYILPDGLTDIHGSAFQGCESLETLYIPESVELMGGWHAHDDYDWSEGTSPYPIVAYSKKLREIHFGSEEVRDMFIYSAASEAIISDAYTSTLHIDAYNGLIAYVHIADALKNSQSGDTIGVVAPNAARKPVVVKENDVAIIPAGVTLVIPEGISVTNKGSIVNNGTIINFGTIDDDYDGSSIVNNGIYAVTNPTNDGCNLPVEKKTLAYSITYNLNGGAVAGSNPIGYVKGQAQLVLTAPTKANYVFDGWYEDEGLSDAFVFNGENGDITLYAKWLDARTVSFVTNGGSAVANAIVGDGKTLTPPANPTKSGYTFAGWYSDDTLETEYDFETAVIEDFTLYAKWIPVHTVSFDTNGGSEVGAVEVVDGETLAPPTNPTKSGYTFDGWYTDADCTAAYDFTKPVTGPLTLYAKWNAIIYYVPTEPDREPEQKPDPEVYVPCDGGEDCHSDGFIDLDHDQWYHDAVDYALQSKLMHGTGEDKFSPEATTTRAMVWAMLARHAGEDTGSDWDADGQNWAVASGISDGLGGSDNITREQVIAMLWRYAGRPAVSGDLSAFNDADKVSDWAKEAMAWAVAEGIIKGDGSGAINPTGVATRAEVAQIFLNRFGK